MRSAVGAACDFTLDFFEEAVFFFFSAVVEVEEVCAVLGRPAPDTAGAVLTRSAAPKMKSQPRLLIVCSSFCYPGGIQTFVIPRHAACRGISPSLSLNRREFPRAARNDKTKYSFHSL